MPAAARCDLTVPFASVCHQCREAVEEGTMATFIQGYGLYHQGCAPAEPLPSVGQEPPPVRTPRGV